MDKIYYERNLPHWQPRGGTFFLTYRLADSMPTPILANLKSEMDFAVSEVQKVFSGEELKQEVYKIHLRHFGKYDGYLDQNLNEPYWLGEDAIARQVADSLHHCGHLYFKLFAFCIMSNHVHLLIKQHEGAPLLNEIMQRHKGFTGHVCNQLLNRHGDFWQAESYDHLVRDEHEFLRIVDYIVLNPVKAGLVKDWKDWKWTYVHPGLLDRQEFTA